MKQPVKIAQYPCCRGVTLVGRFPECEQLEDKKRKNEWAELAKEGYKINVIPLERFKKLPFMQHGKTCKNYKPLMSSVTSLAHKHGFK